MESAQDFRVLANSGPGKHQQPRTHITRHASQPPGWLHNDETRALHQRIRRDNRPPSTGKGIGNGMQMGNGPVGRMKGAGQQNRERFLWNKPLRRRTRWQQSEKELQTGEDDSNESAFFDRAIRCGIFRHAWPAWPPVCSPMAARTRGMTSPINRSSGACIWLTGIPGGNPHVTISVMPNTRMKLTSSSTH